MTEYERDREEVLFLVRKLVSAEVVAKLLNGGILHYRAVPLRVESP